MLKTLARWLAAAVLILIIAFALFSCESAGWRWLTKGGWHTTARISSLTPQEREWAGIAWRYFENKTNLRQGWSTVAINSHALRCGKWAIRLSPCWQPASWV